MSSRPSRPAATAAGQTVPAGEERLSQVVFPPFTRHSTWDPLYQQVYPGELSGEQLEFIWDSVKIASEEAAQRATASQHVPVSQQRPSQAVIPAFNHYRIWAPQYQQAYPGHLSDNQLKFIWDSILAGMVEAVEQAVRDKYLSAD